MTISRTAHPLPWPSSLHGFILEADFPWIAQHRQQAAMPFPDKNAVISLREVHAENVRTICLLDVAANQRGLVAPNALSLAQAYVHPTAWPRAVYAGEIPVGFAMLEDPTLVPSAADPATPIIISLWRFMIDARFQSLGFGESALSQLIAHARARPDARAMELSFVPQANNPEPFYQRLGFARTGEMDDDEVVMRLNFNTDTRLDAHA
jgi:diamine N-acetyltransferase